MAEKSSNCCHCVNIDSPDIGKYFKAKRITDEFIKEDGKKYYKIQWEDTWAEEEDLQSCTDLLEQYAETGKPQIELLAHTENVEDNSRVFVLRVHASTVNTDDGNLSIYGLDGQHLIDKMSELQKKQAIAPDAVQEDVKMVTYAQLQKVGFLVDEEDNLERETRTAPNPMSIDVVESAKYQMYSQVAINGAAANTTEPFTNNDLGSPCRDRRTYTQRRRQSFQLHKCELCGCEFVHRTHLKIHLRTHTGEKPYKCQYCGRSFAQKGNLHVHMKIHTGEKEYVCEFCNKAFITNAQLYVHVRTHTNPNRKKPYATGRPLKDLPEQLKDNRSADQDNDETPNQIIVRLVQPNTEKDNVTVKPRSSDPSDNSDIPTLSVDEDELKNLSDENGAMNNLPSLHSISQQETFRIRTDNRNSASNQNSGEIVHVLVTQ